MKKLLISIRALLMMAFVVVLFVNAGNPPKDTKKAQTEVKKDVPGGTSKACCNPSECKKGVTCDPAKCKEICCDHKDMKCDPATCAGHKEVMECPHSSGCPGTCHSKTTQGK